MAEDIKIRLSEEGDLEEIMEIFAHAKRFMRDNGNPTQWEDGYPSEEIVLGDISRGNSYLCVDDDGCPVGVFSFIPGPDVTYATISGGNWMDNDAPYHVIHRLASSGRVKGVAAACLDWCFSQVRNIRIDTHKDNTVMQRLLDEYGFVRCGTINTHDGTQRIAYQKIKA